MEEGKDLINSAVKELPKQQPELRKKQNSELQPIVEEEAAKTEKLQEIRTELQQETEKRKVVKSVIRSKFQVPEKVIDFSQRVKNLVTDKRVASFARSASEMTGVVFGLTVIRILADVPALDIVASPASLGFFAWRFVNLLNKDSFNLGQFSRISKETSFENRTLPGGTKIKIGDELASIHVDKNIFAMADLDKNERKVALPLDALRTLKRIADKVEAKDEDVSQIKALRTSSYLVGQNADTFQKLGFKIEESKNQELKDFISKIGKAAMFTSTFGLRRLFTQGNLSGFKEAREIDSRGYRTAWITSQDLVAHKSDIAQELARVEKVNHWLRLKSEKS